jgi:hypothetical protein
MCATPPGQLTAIAGYSCYGYAGLGRVQKMRTEPEKAFSFRKGNFSLSHVSGGGTEGVETPDSIAEAIGGQNPLLPNFTSLGTKPSLATKTGSKVKHPIPGEANLEESS